MSEVAHPKPPERPIGFWLKKLDRLIDDAFDRQLGAAQVSRRQWQVLNLLESPQPQSELVDELAPFLADADTTLRPMLAELLERGWLRAADTRFSLTDAGRAELGRLRVGAGEIRTASTAGIAAEEYAVAMEVLARMAANLGAFVPSQAER